MMSMAQENIKWEGTTVGGIREWAFKRLGILLNEVLETTTDEKRNALINALAEAAGEKWPEIYTLFDVLDVADGYECW
ncbi:MAG: hypothetical protein ACPLTR_10525 [Thermacetogeniaceae bacterium]